MQAQKFQPGDKVKVVSACGVHGKAGVVLRYSGTRDPFPYDIMVAGTVWPMYESELELNQDEVK